MPKFNKDAEITFNIEEVIGVLKESDKNDWCKAVARISWNDRPTTLDIRTMNLSKPFAGKGVSLTDEEADRLVEVLLESDFGSLETLERAVNKKRSRFTIFDGLADAFSDDDEMYTIHIEV